MPFCYYKSIGNEIPFKLKQQDWHKINDPKSNFKYFSLSQKLVNMSFYNDNVEHNAIRAIKFVHSLKRKIKI